MGLNIITRNIIVINLEQDSNLKTTWNDRHRLSGQNLISDSLLTKNRNDHVEIIKVINVFTV